MADGFERKWALIDAKKEEIQFERLLLANHAEAFTRSVLSPEYLAEFYREDFRRMLEHIRQLERERNELINRDYREFAEGNELAEVVPIR